MRRFIAFGFLAVLMVLAARILATGGGDPVDPFDSSVTVDSTTTLKTGGSEDWHGRATIKRRPSDDALVMIHRTASTHASNDAQLHIRFSDDDGDTWTADDTTLGGDPVSGFPMNPSVGNIAHGDGWLIVAPNGDLILHMWSVNGTVPSATFNGTYQSRSTDGGHTWSTPAAVTWTESPFVDDESLATEDDFVFDRTIYVGARVYHDTDGVPTSIFLAKSDDNGRSWEYVSTIVAQDEGVDGTGGQELGMEYVGNDTIIAMIRDNAHEDSYRRYSTDMGQTWGTLDNVDNQVGLASRQRVYTRSHLQGLDGWWKDPVLIMVGFVHQTFSEGMPRRNAVWVSPDRGETWEGPHYVAAQTDDGGYGDIFWNGDGYSVISYEGTFFAADLKQYDLTVDFS